MKNLLRAMTLKLKLMSMKILKPSHTFTRNPLLQSHTLHTLSPTVFLQSLPLQFTVLPPLLKLMQLLLLTMWPLSRLDASTMLDLSSHVLNKITLLPRECAIRRSSFTDIFLITCKKSTQDKAFDSRNIYIENFI